MGLGNVITGGFFAVYYPPPAVLPEYQRQGIGREIMNRLKKKYDNFHQRVLIADGGAVQFYQKCDFTQAGKCRVLWIYDGEDHDGPASLAISKD